MTPFLKVLTVVLFANWAFSATSQSSNPRKDWRSKTTVSLHHQVQLNHVELSPFAEYRVNQRWGVGFGLANALYLRDTERKNKLGSGIRFAGRGYVRGPIFFHAEYVWANMPQKVALDFSYNRVFKGDLLLGIGYNQAIGQKWFASGEILYNPIYSELSFYSSKLLARIQIGLQL